MKNIQLFLGIPFLSTARALVDIYDSNLTLGVVDDVITFEMILKVKHEEPREEV